MIQMCASARTWTDVKGRTIEGELVRVEAEIAVIKVNGREFRIPFQKLSEKDQEFLRTHEDQSLATVSEAGSLFGTELKAGETVEVTGPLNDKSLKALSGNKLKPTQMKIKLSLPPDFDSAKPQKVFWAVGGINNEAERIKGNIGTFRRGNLAASKGWLVIAADTEHGNPRESTVQVSEGDPAFHDQVFDELSAVWPEFNNWKHACGGHSSGAKGAFFRLAQLLNAKANAVGGFFSGCNQSMALMPCEETRLRKSAFKKVKGFQSTGDKDHLVPASSIKRVTDEMKDGGIRNSRSQTFPGGHVMSSEQFGEALDWFAEEE